MPRQGAATLDTDAGFYLQKNPQSISWWAPGWRGHSEFFTVTMFALFIWPMILKKMRWRIEKRDRGVSSRLSYCEGEITAGGISESFLETGEHSCYIPLDQSSWKPRSSSKGPAVNHRTWVTQTEPLLGQSWPAPSPPSPTPNRLCWANGTLSDS